MIHDLDLGQRRSERGHTWVLPAVAALCVGAFVAAAGAGRGLNVGSGQLSDASGPGVVQFDRQRVVLSAAPVAAPAPEAVSGARRGSAVRERVAPQVQPDLVGRSLALPVGSYASLSKLPNGVSGLTAQVQRTLQFGYRLADGSFVVLVPLPTADPFRGLDPSQYTVSGLRVRGSDARVLVGNTPAAPTILIWTERDRTYQLSSQTHSLAELASLAEKLR